MDATDTEPTPAPRLRKALAGLIDAAVMALPTVLQMRRVWRARETKRPAARQPGWMGMLAPVAAVLGEQVGTPGGWIMGVRTVDRRTGRRLELWRTLTVALVGLATRLLTRRLTPRPSLPSEAEQRERTREVQAIKERYADDEDALHAEMMRHYTENRVNVTANFWPPLVAGLASALVNRTVRRRLAPTLVVLRAPAEQPAPPHSPYERPMTSSMISSVPAPMRFRRMSRHTRSTPYSRM
jgi:hypothetical protein